MSQKWQRSRAWDDQHLRSPALRPVKFIFRAFSSITLAVTLLSFVAFYAVVASIPIGLLAVIPTWLIYSASLLVPMALVWTLLVLVLSRVGLSRPVRFAAGLVGVIASGVVIAWAWSVYAWPALRYEPSTGEGLRLWPEFVARYDATTLRRLPGFEMTELEFYSWWPMRVALLLFVANMIVATVRRIEFTFKNIGVLTVHTGIITIALGSVYYQKLKKEGDTLVVAGFDQTANQPAIGPPQHNFYDNTAVVLYTTQDRTGMGAAMWEQRPIPRLPRYNDYNLAAGGERAGTSVWTRSPLPKPWDGAPDRTLDIPLGPTMDLLDEDISLRAVGYATYAELKEDTLRIDPASVAGPLKPMRVVALYMRVPDEHGHVLETPAFEFTLMPSLPQRRVSENQAFGLEYTLSMPEERWDRLSQAVPPDTEHALIIEVPGAERVVVPARIGGAVPVGETGYTVAVEQLEPTPPMPIITRGYEGASSSVAVVRITKPDGTGYQRWVYSRFGELNQDLLEASGATGRPIRRDADSEIMIDYLDMSKLQIYLDEQADGTVRALVRQHGGDLNIIDDLPDGERLVDVVDKIDIAVTERWEHAEPFERPVPVPAIDQDREAVGSHQHAAVAVEINATVFGQPWSRVLWVPFSRYMGLGSQNERTARLPDGRVLKFAFGRRQHRFPGFGVQLLDFEMIAYDHRGAPRDYQSVLRVAPAPVAGRDNPEFEAYDHVCKLNAPLRAPFHWDPEASWLTNTTRRLAAGINPDQYKLSQSGWDQQGWNRSGQMIESGRAEIEAAVAAGDISLDEGQRRLSELPERPFVNFTILGVGNNPGIHVIALGGILMGVGIPWAFYVKPLLIRREKNRLAREHTLRKGEPGEAAS